MSKIMDKVIIHLNTQITEPLYLEGLANEIRRNIQQLRKKMNLEANNKIDVYYDQNKEFEWKPYNYLFRSKIDLIFPNKPTWDDVLLEWEIIIGKKCGVHKWIRSDHFEIVEITK